VRGDLPDQPPAILVHILQRVVNAEGPIHVDEAFRRIRELWGLKRTGDRIHEALTNTLAIAEQRAAVKRRGDYLWPAKDRPVPVRTRTDDPPPKIDLICDAEIAAALEMVLRQQFATRPEELATRASRLLGFQATSDSTMATILLVIDTLVANGALARLPNGMVDLAK
jgi:hypothetical protein